MNSGETASMFGTLIGTAVGAYIGGPFGAAIGGSILGGAMGSWFGASDQEKQQKKLLKAHARQNELLRTKLQKDKEELFSSVRSSISQSNAAMGAVY